MTDSPEHDGPGRPAIGPAILVRLGPDLLTVVDVYATDHGITRAEAIRRLLQIGLDTTNQTGQPE